MRYASQSVTIATRIADAMLAALSARPAAALLDTPVLKLSKDPGFTVTPDSDATVLSVNESDVSGYTAGGYAVVFVGPVNNGTLQQALLMDQVVVRTLGTPDVGGNVYGWWIEDDAGFVCGEAFQGGAIALELPGDFLDLLVAFPAALQLAMAL